MGNNPPGTYRPNRTPPLYLHDPDPPPSGPPKAQGMSSGKFEVVPEYFIVSPIQPSGTPQRPLANKKRETKQAEPESAGSLRGGLCGWHGYHQWLSGRVLCPFLPVLS